MMSRHMRRIVYQKRHLNFQKRPMIFQKRRTDKMMTRLVLLWRMVLFWILAGFFWSVAGFFWKIAGLFWSLETLGGYRTLALPLAHKRQFASWCTFSPSTTTSTLLSSEMTHGRGLDLEEFNLHSRSMNQLIFTLNLKIGFRV